MISAETLIELFQQALKEKWGYIWGTAGVKWTAARQKELEKTADPDRAQGRKYGSKWIGHTVADCSGLFSWAFKKLGGYMYHGSDTMYRKYCVNKGELKKGKRTDNGALKPGTAVFVWNGKKYSHVGLYAGDGTVIEAMGTVSGVTTTKVTDGKWTHWGELAGVDYASNNSQFHDRRDQSPCGDFDGCNVAGVTQITDLDTCSIIHNSGLEKTENRDTIRKGSKGTAVAELQTLLVKLGYGVGPCGIDGDFGNDTEAAVKRFQSDHGLAVDGVAGPATLAALEKAVVSAAEKPKKQLYRVIISGLDLTQAKALVNNYPANSKFESEN